MSDDPTQDAHSLGIALRLAQAQIRELRKQLVDSVPANSADISSKLAEADSTSENPSLSHCMNPNTFSKNPEHIASVLHQMASGEGCDGEPYDQMQQAGDYINQLERELAQAIKERDEAQRIGPIEPNFYTAKLEQQLATATEVLEIIHTHLNDRDATDSDLLVGSTAFKTCLRRTKQALAMIHMKEARKMAQAKDMTREEFINQTPPELRGNQGEQP